MHRTPNKLTCFEAVAVHSGLQKSSAVTFFLPCFPCTIVGRKLNAAVKKDESKTQILPVNLLDWLCLRDVGPISTALHCSARFDVIRKV